MLLTLDYTASNGIMNPAITLAPNTRLGDYTCYKKKKLFTRCGPDQCSDTGTETVQLDGTCASCDEYSKPAPDARSCISQDCNGRQKLLPSGNCEYCPSYTRQVTKKTCRADECGVRSRLMFDGTCIECRPYEIVSSNGKYCYE